MDTELDDKLVADFPNLYRMRHGKMSHTCMCWGFDVGDGWHDIIRALSVKLEALILAMPEEARVECYADQVKEKFGGLRFYMSCQTDEMSALIREAEAASYVTCESCGKPGERRGGGYIQTLCDEHNAARPAPVSVDDSDDDD